MPVNYPGGDTLGIVTKNATGGKDSLNQDITNDSVVWVYGCVFEPYMYGINEQETDTITSQEKAYAYLPYLAGVGIPTVDAAGHRILDGSGNPVPVTADNTNFVRPKRPDPSAVRDYKVFGKPTVQYDIDGQPDHVLIVCEWQGG